MGKPGAGKGTQATKLLKHYQLTHISTGDIYREEMQKESPIGLIAKEYVSRGELVPDDITNDIVEEVLKKKRLSQRLYAGRISAKQSSSRSFGLHSCSPRNKTVRCHKRGCK